MQTLQQGMPPHQALLFIDAPGGTGKTFLITLNLDTIPGGFVIAVASSGVAAPLLHGG